MNDQTWNPLLRDQLAWHWSNNLRARLNGLTDDEYFWEPAPGCWSVRPRGTGTAPMQAGSGAMTIDHPLAALVLHINRELIHHMAEVCLLRDLYLHTRQTRQEAS